MRTPIEQLALRNARRKDRKRDAARRFQPKGGVHTCPHGLRYTEECPRCGRVDGAFPSQLPPASKEATNAVDA